MGQAGHFGRCRTAAGRGVRFVAQENASLGKFPMAHGRNGDHLVGERLDFPLDVLGVEPGAVEGAVGDVGAEQIGDGGHAACHDIGAAFQHQAHRAHAEDHAVPTTIKG